MVGIMGRPLGVDFIGSMQRARQLKNGADSLYELLKAYEETLGENIEPVERNARLFDCAAERLASKWLQGTVVARKLEQGVTMTSIIKSSQNYFQNELSAFIPSYGERENILHGRFVLALSSAYLTLLGAAVGGGIEYILRNKPSATETVDPITSVIVGATLGAAYSILIVHEMTKEKHRLDNKIREEALYIDKVLQRATPVVTNTEGTSANHGL